MYIEIVVPEEMTPADVAKTFAAYLMGPLAHDNICTSVKTGEYFRGPFRKEKDNDLRCQLDDTNDYFLHFEVGGKARIGCRYDTQEPTLKALVELFKLRFPTREERRALLQA